MMPRLVKLISEKYPSAKSSLSSLPGRAWWKKTEKARTSKDGYHPSPSEGATANVKSPYERLEEGFNDTSGKKDQVRNAGIQRTVDIEMTTWYHANEEGWVSSII